MIALKKTGILPSALHHTPVCLDDPGELRPRGAEKIPELKPVKCEVIIVEGDIVSQRESWNLGQLEHITPLDRQCWLPRRRALSHEVNRSTQCRPMAIGLNGDSRAVLIHKTTARTPKITLGSHIPIAGG